MEDVAHTLNYAVFKLFLIGLLIDFQHPEWCGRQA